MIGWLFIKNIFIVLIFNDMTKETFKVILTVIKYVATALLGALGYANL